MTPTPANPEHDGLQEAVRAASERRDAIRTGIERTLVATRESMLELQGGGPTRAEKIAALQVTATCELVDATTAVKEAIWANAMALRELRVVLDKEGS